MAINIELLNKRGLEPYDLMLMEIIFQNTSMDMSEVLEQYLTEACLRRLLTLELLTTVQKKRKADSDYKVMRLTKKGKTLLVDARKLDYTIEDSELFTHLENMYTKMEKSVGNPEKTKDLLGWFRLETGYSRRQIYRAISLYLKIQEDESGGKFISSLENLIWKPPSLFSTKWKLSDSKLYQFIHDNKQHLNGNSKSKKSN